VSILFQCREAAVTEGYVRPNVKSTGVMHLPPPVHTPTHVSKFNMFHVV